MLQKQIQDTQSTLLGAPEGPAQDAIKMQLALLAQQMQMIQQQISEQPATSLGRSAKGRASNSCTFAFPCELLLMATINEYFC